MFQKHFLIASLLVLLSRGGKHMKVFQGDLNYNGRFIFGLEHHKQGDEITRRALSHYLQSDKALDEQLPELEKVCCLFKGS